MSEANLTDRIKSILAQVTRNPGLADSLSDSSSIVDDVGLDSLQMINFVLAVEQELDLELEIENMDYSYLGSIAKFASFVEGQRG